MDVEAAGPAEPEPAQPPAVSVHRAGDAGVGDAHDRQPGLDGAHPCDLEMLVRACGLAEPGVVGEVQQPFRARIGRHRLAREDRLEADQRAERRQAGQGERRGARPGREILPPDR